MKYEQSTEKPLGPDLHLSLPMGQFRKIDRFSDLLLRQSDGSDLVGASFGSEGNSAALALTPEQARYIGEALIHQATCAETGQYPDPGTTYEQHKELFPATPPLEEPLSI